MATAQLTSKRLALRACPAGVITAA
jgi:hypothetical protein